MKKMNHLLGFMVLGLALSVTSCAGKTFTVTFDTNDGTTIASVTVDGKGTIGTVEAPTKEGHNFAGWYLDEAFTEAVDLSTYVPTADITVYAKWTLESFDVNFEENGGTAVQDVTVDWGTPVTLPAAPTKEGYDFVKWYLDEELLQPYANQQIKEDTTLYAKWRSGLVYTGTHVGEATYNADGTYTFSVDLPLWGRFSLMYYGNLISANDENLVISGLFNPGASADWTRNLYCDVPEGGTEVDYTTFLCCKAGVYDITFDPAAMTLDIQDGNPVVPIPQEGFCYRYTEGASADLVDPIMVEVNPETNSYAFEVELAAWRYVEMYYNGVIVDSVDVDKAFNVNGGNIYIGDDPDPTTAFYTSTPNKYRFEYTPASGDAKAKVTTSIVIEIPETGVYYMYTNPENVLQAPKAATYDEATDSYSFEVTLEQWRYVNIYNNGQALKFADVAISGDGWANNDYNTSSIVGALYIPDSPEQLMRPGGTGEMTYKLTYKPADNSLAIDNLSYEPAPEPTIPETGVYFLYSTNADGTVYPAASDITEENGVYSITVGLDQWKWAAVYKDGQPVAAADMTISGDGWVDGTYNNSVNGSLYIDSDPAHLLRSQKGVVEYKLSYNPTDNSLVIDNLAIGGETENYVWTVSSDQYAVMFNEGTEINTKAKWRFYIVVDGQGRIAYMCDMPINGYGSPLDSNVTYTKHSAYADAANNPAFVIADGGYKVVVPAGGFAIEAYTGADGSGTARELVKQITGIEYAENSVNTNSLNVDNVRLSYDAAAGTVEVSKVEVSTWTVASDPNALMYTEAGAEVNTKAKWRVYVIVDGEGKIAYLCDMPINGYGSPLDSNVTYARHSSYADAATNPAFVIADGGYKVVVPEGGFIIEAHAGAASTAGLVKTLTGKDYAEHSANSGDINVDNYRLSYDAATGVVTITIL